MPLPGIVTARPTIQAMRTTLTRFMRMPAGPGNALVLRTQVMGAAKTFEQQLAATDEQKVDGKEVGLTDFAEGEAFIVALQTAEQVLPGVTSGILLAIEGFEDGDILSGVQGIMDSCASLSAAIGAAIGAGVGFLAGGPAGAMPGATAGFLIGSLVGSFFSMIEAILGFFAPATESIAKQIQTLLQEQRVEDTQRDVKKVHNSFLIYASTVNDQCNKIGSNRHFQPGVAARVIDQLNFVEGNTITTYWGVIDWLANPKNQRDRHWPLILEATCNAYTLLLIAIVRLNSIVCGKPILEQYRAAREAGDERRKADFNNLWDAAASKLEVYSVCNRLNLKQLAALRATAQNWGTLWRLIRRQECGVVDPKVQPSEFGGDDKKLSVTVCSQDQTLAEPTYQCYAIAGDDQLYIRRISSYGSSQKRMADTEVSVRGLGVRLDDIFATPGTDLSKKNYAYVYELSDQGKKIVARLRDAEGNDMNQQLFQWTFGAGATPDRLTSIRAVHDPYAQEEDSANASLKGITSILYGANGNFNRFAVLLNGLGYGKTHYHLNSPFPANTPGLGIAVDQDYLWVFSNRQFACTTHAKAVAAAMSTAHAQWAKSTKTPDSKDIVSLYPCDDGTLIVSVNDGPVYSGAYRVDQQKSNIAGYGGQADITWTTIRDTPTRGGLEKLPLFCWPQFESLIETLETFQQVFYGEQTSGVRAAKA